MRALNDMHLEGRSRSSLMPKEHNMLKFLYNPKVRNAEYF